MSEEVKGIMFFRRVSDVPGDETLNGSLGSSDVDNNFYYLREMLINSAYTAEYSVQTEEGEIETTAELVLTRVNGKELHVDMTPFLPNFEEYDIQTTYDPIAGELSLALLKDGELVTVNTINGVITEDNFKKALDDSMDEEVISRVLSDDTIKGIGTKDQLLGVSPLYINGQMKSAKAFIDITEEGSKMPEASTGDYFVIKDFSDEYGKLYPYEAVKKIQLDLDEEAQEKYNIYSADTSTLGWRVPCAEDWDDMLNAVELEYAKSIGCVEYDASGNPHSTLDTYPQYTHSSDNFIGYALGYIAGRLLKSKSYWSGDTENKGWQVEKEYIGTDTYGFKAEPVGYAMIDEVLLMHGKENAVWIAGTGANFEPQSKLHQYDYIKFYGKGNAKSKTFLASGATSPAPANCVRTDLTTTDSYRSIRLVKEYDGGNYHNHEFVLSRGYDTVMLPSLTAENGFKIWTVENFDIDYQLADGTYKYGSKPTINDKLDDADKFKKYFLAYKSNNGWEFREMSNGDSVVVAKPIYSGDNEYDEYRLVNGELINKTTDEFKIYNKIADVEQNLERLQHDYVKTSVWAWGAIDDVTKLAKLNKTGIENLTANVVKLGDTLNELSDKTQEAIDTLNSDVEDLYKKIAEGCASASCKCDIISAKVDSLSAEVEELRTKEENDYLTLDGEIATLSGNYMNLEALVGDISGKVSDLAAYIEAHTEDINAIPTLSADLYSLSAQMDSRYDEIIAIINQKIAQLQHDLIDIINGRFITVSNRVDELETKMNSIETTICSLDENIKAVRTYVNANIPVLNQAVKTLEDANLIDRVETLEEKVSQCCADSEGGEDEGVSLDYIQKMIDDTVSNHRLTSITINDKLVASEGNGIDNKDCGTSVNYDFETDDMEFEPITSETMSLDNITPFNVGGIPCGTSLRELSGMNLSLLLQNILFPTIYPTIYQNPSLVLTNEEPLFSEPIGGDYEKDGCYEHKNYFVVEVGTHFHRQNLPIKDSYVEGADAGYYENSKAYIKADCSKLTEDQFITNGISGVTYLVKRTPYNITGDGSNVVYPTDIQESEKYCNGEDCVYFDTVGEVETYAESHYKPTENAILDSNGNPTEDIYVEKDGKTVLTTLDELKKTVPGQRYNFYFQKSNSLKVYVSEPIFLTNGNVLSGMLDGMYSDQSTPLYYEGWRKGYTQDEDGNVSPKNGVGSVIAMQKWGQMNAEFNIVTDFASLDFGVLTPIEVSKISMKAYDTNEGTNLQTSNFVSKDVLLDETYNYWLNNQDEWLARNIPNGLVKYDKPIYIAFEHWGDCKSVTICAYYLYTWVGGAQVPSTFGITTNNPFVDTNDYIEAQ